MEAKVEQLEEWQRMLWFLCPESIRPEPVDSGDEVADERDELMAFLTNAVQHP